MSFFSSGPPSDADHDGYDDEDDHSQDGAQNYFRDQQDDFQSDDAFEDEFETSQNTIHNGSGQAGRSTSRNEPREELNDNYSAQGDGDASYYDTAEYSEDESVREKSQDRPEFDQGDGEELHGLSNSKSAIRNEVDGSTARDEEGNSPNDGVIQRNSTDGNPSATDVTDVTIDAGHDSAATNDSATDGEAKIIQSSEDSVALSLAESTVAADIELSRTILGRGDTVQQLSQVTPRETVDHRITDTVVPSQPGKENSQPRAIRPPSSSANGPASPAEFHLGQGTRLIGRTAERGIQPFVRPPVAQISPGQGPRLISGIADRGSAQEQKRGDATKPGLRRRFELGSQFTMNSQQENLGVERRQNIPSKLPPLGRSPGVAKIDARVQAPTNLRLSGTSDASKAAATSYKDVGQTNLLENEVYGGSTSAPSNDSSHHRDDLTTSNSSDSLLWNFQKEASIIAEGDNHHPVSASNAAKNNYNENERVISTQIASRTKDTSGTVRNMATNASTNKTSSVSANLGRDTSLEYLSRRLPVPPTASSMNDTASIRGGEPARQIRRAVEPFSKSEVSSDKSRIAGDIEAQIDSVISGTSKRLREIQQDCGNGSLEHHSKKRGYGQIEVGSGVVTSEGPGKKSPQEMDCNVPAFVAALERDSHSLASALCRLMTNDALLLAPLLYKNEKGLSLLREQLKSH